jgi:hypothetical protein
MYFDRGLRLLAYLLTMGFGLSVSHWPGRGFPSCCGQGFGCCSDLDEPGLDVADFASQIVRVDGV